MVTVPVYRGSSVARAARPVGAVQPVRNPVGEAVGDGLRELGGQAAGYARQQDALNDEFDRTQARQMLLDFQSQATPVVTTYLSSEGIDALNGSTTTREQLTKLRQDFSGKATNDRMRRYFDQAAGGIETGFVDKISSHSIGALKTQQVSIAKGEQAQFMDSAVLNWSDDNAFRINLDAGLAAVEAEAKVHGITGVGLEVAKRNYKSATRLAVLNQLLADNRQDDAIGYAAVHRADFNANDTLAISRSLKEPMELRFSIAGADMVMGGQSAPNVPAGEGVAYSSKSLFTHGIIPIEGGTGKNGQFLTSPKGAIGPAQVMPGTAPEAAKLAGLKWDDKKYRTDHAYNVAIGEAYFQKQLRDFGDPLKAAAAYNAGPGGLREAMAKAAKSGKSWRDHLPAETKKYVTDFAARMGVAGTSDGVDEMEVYGRLDAVAADSGWTPEQKRSVQAEVDRRVQRAKGLQAARENDAYEAGISRAVQLGNGFTNVSQLGTSFASMSPQQQLTLTNMAEANLKAQITAATPKDGNDVQRKLERDRALDPAGFARRDLREFSNQITAGAMTNLMEWQKEYATKGGDFANSITSGITRFSKIDQLNLKGDDYAAVFNDMDRFIRSMTDNGRAKVTDDIVKQAWQRATLKVATPGALWGENTQRRYEVAPGKPFRVTDIPAGARSDIVNAWKRTHAGREPNDAQIAQIYIDRYGAFQ